MSAGPHLPGRLVDVWIYLAASPLLWLTLTLAAYAVAIRIAAATRQSPIANPVLIAAAILIALLNLTETSYETYFAGAQFVHFLMGPATVALAVPLYRHADLVRQALWPLLAALVAGSLTAILSAILIAWVLGAPPEIIVSLAPKSVTTPIAMSLAAALGGIPSLTAVLVIATGICGAMMLTPLTRLLGVTDPAAQGFAAGVAAHGIGTARAFHVSTVAGTFAGVAMALNGAMTSLLLPALALLWR